MIPAFDIVPETPDPEALGRCTLLMEVGERFFSYILYDRSARKLLGLRQYRLETEAQQGDTEWLSDIIEADELLKVNSRESIVIYNFPDSSLLPEQYFHIELNKPLTELVYGNARKGLVLSEKVHGWQLYNIYRIPREVHSIMQSRFAAGKYWHSYSLMLNAAGRRKRAQAAAGSRDDEPARIRIQLYNDSFSMMVIVNEKLLLMQTFRYQAPEDVSYFLLSACRQFNLSQDDIMLTVAGLVDADSALYQEIGKYFREVETDTLPDAMRGNALPEEYPEHYFSPLFEMISCV